MQVKFKIEGFLTGWTSYLIKPETETEQEEILDSVDVDRSEGLDGLKRRTQKLLDDFNEATKFEREAKNIEDELNKELLGY